MLSDLEIKVADFAKANGLFNTTEKILLAVSGGADSTALLYIMQKLKSEGILNAQLLCAHINHQLRGNDADLDEQFVIDQANSLNLTIITKRVDVRTYAQQNKLSIETAARKLRIDTLLEIAKSNSCPLVATAHQKNDNAETILHRLIRGTGFRGLAGIWPIRTFDDRVAFVRPLLCVRRDEITEYLQERNLKWQEDRTNIDCTYKRNFIRHRLLPQLQQQSADSIVEQLSRLADSSRRFYMLLSSKVEASWPNLSRTDKTTVTLNLKSFLQEPMPVQAELVRKSLTTLGCGEKYLNQQHYEKILQLARQNVGGKKIVLPNKFITYRESQNLVFTKPQKTPRPPRQKAKSVNFKIPGYTVFGQYLIKAAVLDANQTDLKEFIADKDSFSEIFDLDTLKIPLIARPRRQGDRFWPLGLPKEKKLGKFLTSARVPHNIRNKILIIADSERIIWVCPVRISEQAKVTPQTHRILQLQITEDK